MKTLIIILSLISFAVTAETSFIVPLVTTHAGPGHSRVNNDIYGIGIEYKNDYVYSLTYLPNNSYSERSFYLTASNEIKLNKDISFLYGLTLATGYERISDSGIILAPIYGLQFDKFRVVTTFPVAHISCPDGANCADFVSVLAVFPF